MTGRIGQRLGAWRVMALIARGGMGEVYRVERADGQFAQQAALKLMRSGVEEGGGMARFKAEQHILASLDHPHLAKLIDGGITDDGLPYFVMELVDGEPIDAYCERLELPLERRLQLFRVACDVVHYAHRKGVVHRDIKCSNLLVTHDGAMLKLVDFGIAKRLEPAAESPANTTLASPAFTPSYASPEQISGRPVTPASDLYSLGVVLYRLLTGTSPYGAAEGDAYALAKAITERPPILPSVAAAAFSRRLAQQLRGDLDAVLSMALRKEPERRYSTSEALADDLFRHLEGLPVHARRGAWSYRAGRLLVRHRALAAGVLVANLALLGGIGFAGYKVYEATRERQRAERHMAAVRQLAQVFIFDIHDAISTLPGSSSARKLVVEQALGYLQELGEEPSGDALLTVQLAAGYRKVGDIQGRPHTPNLADPKGAVASYDKGVALLQPLVQRMRPQDAAWRPVREELSLLLLRQGTLRIMLSRFKEAQASLAEAETLARALAAEAPSRLTGQLLLGQILVQRCRRHFYAEEHAVYRELAPQAAQVLESVLRELPGDREATLSLATLYTTRGEYLMAQRGARVDNARQALAAFQRSTALVQEVQQREPMNAPLLRQLAIGHNRVGWTLLRIGDARRAAVEYRNAIERLEGLAAQAPNEVQFKADIARANADLSRALFKQGDLPGSVRAGEAAVALFDTLPEGARAENSVRFSEGAVHYWLGQALEGMAARRGTDRAAACASYRRGLPILQDLHERFGLDDHPDDLHPNTVRAALRHCGPERA